VKAGWLFCSGIAFLTKCIRVVTAASLFDGHAAGTCPERSRRINIMRRIIQCKRGVIYS